MKHVWSVICRHHIVDEESKNVSLIDIVDRLSFEGELPEKRPFELPLPNVYYFISTWMSEKGDVQDKYDVMVKIIDPTGVEIGNFRNELVMEPPDGSRTIGAMETFLYTVDGTYWLELHLTKENDTTPVAHIPIEILHRQSEPEQQASEPTK
ncbi:MAG: hypothetical protein OXG60_10655 [Chloroflexi bacterium]|nr:hypothetical protein [Chloroflexota bacterium]